MLLSLSVLEFAAYGECGNQDHRAVQKPLLSAAGGCRKAPPTLHAPLRCILGAVAAGVGIVIRLSATLLLSHSHPPLLPILHPWRDCPPPPTPVLTCRSLGTMPASTAAQDAPLLTTPSLPPHTPPLSGLLKTFAPLPAGHWAPCLRPQPRAMLPLPLPKGPQSLQAA